jgi:hypothetical protein
MIDNNDYIEMTKILDISNGVMFQFLFILWCYEPFTLLGLITLIYELWFKKP